MRPKFADAIIISTQDNLHYDPCMQALKMGLMYYWKTLSHQVKKKAVIFCSWRKNRKDCSSLSCVALSLSLIHI